MDKNEQFVTMSLERYEQLLNKSFITDYILNTEIPKEPIKRDIFINFISKLKDNYNKNF